MTNDLFQRAKEIIQSNEYITVATASRDSQPWNTPVYAVHDEQYNFFWSSWTQAQHSKNIRENDRIFIVIFDSTRKRGDNNRRGLYIQARAEELELKEGIEHALKYFTSVNGQPLTPNDFQEPSVKRTYRATPEKMWLNDLSESQVTKETIKMRIEVPLDQLLQSRD